MTTSYECPDCSHPWRVHRADQAGMMGCQHILYDDTGSQEGHGALCPCGNAPPEEYLQTRARLDRMLERSRDAHVDEAVRRAVEQLRSIRADLLLVRLLQQQPRDARASQQWLLISTEIRAVADIASDAMEEDQFSISEKSSTVPRGTD